MDLKSDNCVSQNVQTLIMKKRKQEEGGLAFDQGSSSGVTESTGSFDPSKSSTSGSSNANNPSSSTSDLSFQNDDEDVDLNNDYMDEDDMDDDLDDDSDYYANVEFLDDDDDYLTMQSKFDNVDLPPGVEASVPWLTGVASSEIKPSSSVALTLSDVQCSKNDAGDCSSGGPINSTIKAKVQENDLNMMQKFLEFKHFDVVDDFSDHHYNQVNTSGEKPAKNWSKRIQEEWKMLEENLPETIFVRAYESRMDLLRAVMLGPQGTPYHDGLFVFDCFFPTTYPEAPPMVYYYSGGLRINPNLYHCGKVCLSLLGTWSGKQNEMWIPNKSTMLQVLVSIQALILNEQPFFNEPGYEQTYTGATGQKRSKEYNEKTFILSLKTMMYTLKKPPKHFETLIAGHFRARAYDILHACRAYAGGQMVGSITTTANKGCNRPQTEVKNDENKTEFQLTVNRMMNTLVAFFTKNGSTDLDEFRQYV